MGRTKLVALAVALAMLPGVAMAQPAPAAALPASGTTAPTAKPAVPAGQAKAEAVTAVTPTDKSVPTSAGTASASAATSAPDIGADMKGDPTIGQPNGDWQLQPSVTELGQDAHWFNKMLLIMMGGVCVFVFGLLGYTMLRFRAGKNPVASRTTHNTFIEVIWTAVPVLILVIIAVPSFRLLAAQYDPPRADLTIKATGHQWYWEYTYPDLGALDYDSLILTDAEAAKRGDPRLLGVDNRLVVPAGAVVKVLTTSTDVIHSFAMPAFWVKMDAVPGRINETWFKVDRPGVYYGQCSELCGTKHAFMPIVVEVLPPAEFRAWAEQKFAENKIAASSKIDAALTDAINGKAPAPAVAAPSAAGTAAATDTPTATTEATNASAKANGAAPTAGAVSAGGAVASQNSTSTAPAAK